MDSFGESKHPRKRFSTAVQRNCCCFSSEKFKDFWKYNKKGQNMLKITLLFEIIAFFLYVGMYSYNHRDTINQNANDKLTDDMQKKIFYCIVCLWLFIACIYFLWHSINRSIVVELIAFSTSLLILNFFLIYRLTMILFFQEDNEFPNITKTGIDASDRIEAFISLCGLGLLIIFTPLQ